MSNKVRIVREGGATQVYLPDGQKLKMVLRASIDMNPGGPPTLTLVLGGEFTFDPTEQPSDAELTALGLIHADFHN